jgi:hypothetical protein
MLNGSLNYGLLGNLLSREENGVLDGNYDDKVIESLKFAILSSANNGQIDYSLVNGISYKNYWGNSSAYQIINYFGARDGLSVYDKLIINNISASDSIIGQKIVLAFGTMMVSGGIPYIEAGSEFLVSYQNLDNSEDSICTENGAFCFITNGEKKKIEWSFAYRNEETVSAFRSLVNFRKSDKLFIQSDLNRIKNNVKVFSGKDGTLGYLRTYPNAYVNETQKVLVLFNYSNYERSINKFDGDGWERSYQYNLASRDGNSINMKANSIYMETKDRQPVVNQWIMLIIVLGVIGLLYSLNIVLNKRLVEKHGYDIKDINRKYRPFINRKKIQKTDETEADTEAENNNEIVNDIEKDNDENN